MRKYLSGVFVAVLVSLGFVPTSQALTPEEIGELIGIRSQMFGGLLLQETAPGIIFSQDPLDLSVPAVNGEVQPLFEMNVSKKVTIIWKIKNKQAAAFSQAIALPPHMQLAKVASTKNKWHYRLVLDVYSETGLCSGNKAEWRTFVTVGDDPTPQSLVFDKQSSEPGLDHVDLFSVPEGAVDLSIENGLASAFITTSESQLSILIPQHKPKSKVLHKEFINANDVTHSLTGFPTKFYYNSGLGSGRVISVKKKHAQICGNFPWLNYVHKVTDVLFTEDYQVLLQPLASLFMPASAAQEAEYANFILMILGSMQPDSPLPPILPDEAIPMLLQQFGPSPTLVFGLMAFYNALNVMQGSVPTMSFDIANNPKPLFINYRINETKVDEFEAAFVPQGYSLAKMKAIESQETSAYMLSLNIYPLDGNSAQTQAYRAEWSTYVTKDGDPNPRYLLIQAHASAGGLDPVYAAENWDPENVLSAIAPPSIVNYTSDNDQLAITIGTMDPLCMVDPNYCQMQDLLVYTAIAIPCYADLSVATQEWVQANDAIHWGNGVADLGFFDASVNDAPLLKFNLQPTDVLVDTSFSAYLDPTPMHILLFDSEERMALKPWGNLEELMSEALQP